MKAATSTMRVTLEPAGGEAAGWQLLDARSGALIEEGPWVRERMDSEVALPPEDGDYRILVSHVSPERGWAYARGEKLRVVDIAVRDGAVATVNERVTTFRTLRWEGFPRRFLGILAEPWKAIWNNRALIGTMVRRDVEGRYRGSMGDRIWTIAQPLLQMLIYWFVFGLILKSRFKDNPDPFAFVLNFLCGMLPWLAFSEAVGRAPNLISESRNLVKKLVFPVEILPVNLVVTALITEVLALGIYLFFVRAAVRWVPETGLWVPVLMIPQALLTAGVCWAWSAIGLYFRDLAQINGFLLTLLFFLTPICYSEDLLPLGIRAILQKSPLYKLVALYRYVLVDIRSPDWGLYLQLFAISLIVFYAGYALFRRMRRTFVDVL